MRDLSESSLFCLDFLFRYRSQNTRNGFGLWEERAESLLSCLRRLLRAQSLKHFSSLWIKSFQLSPLSRMFVEGSFAPKRDCTFRSHELRLRHKNYSFRKLLRCCKGFKHVKLLMDENHRDAAQNYGVYQALPSHAVTRRLCTEDRLKFDRRKTRVFSDPVFLLLYRPGHLTDLGDFATPVAFGTLLDEERAQMSGQATACPAEGPQVSAPRARRTRRTRRSKACKAKLGRRRQGWAVIHSRVRKLIPNERLVVCPPFRPILHETIELYVDAVG
mmetsp:Transcript_68808/g.139510  ORF Transcript_68808/g.139510 Transcript_68808/m.139510 type:complete len:274 (+) Transcript_68808:441-1262(+)